VQLTIVRHPVLQSGGLFWTPYDRSSGFSTEWWVRDVVDPESTLWFSFHDEANLEVARAELDLASTVGSQYDGAPKPPPGGFVEIEFIEVHSSLRCRGIGRQAVTLIAAEFSDRPTVAFSEEADEFWSSLGWASYGRTDMNPAHYRRLFVGSSDQLSRITVSRPA
jgi:ribosomal protein S18 acetylase RimI-like enzyme